MDILLTLSTGILFGLAAGFFLAKLFFKSYKEEFREEKEKNENLNRQLGELSVIKEKYLEQESEYGNKFKLIASEILKTSSKELSENSQKELQHILLPLKERIESFEKKIEAAKEEGIKNTAELKSEVKGLAELSNKLSSDANNLTKALKGDKKIQGDWGENTLQLLLEHSGLQRDINYFVQKNFKNDHDENKRPDVVINLPEEKHVIIDSKLTLNSFINYVKDIR